MKHLILILFSIITSGLYGQFDFVNSGVNSNIRFIESKPNYGVILAGGNNLIKSLDSGLTWTQAGTFGSLPNFKDALILGPNEFIVCGSVSVGTNRLFKTTNGGINWTVGYSSPNKLNGIDNHFDTIITVGENGTILRSVNNGVSWINLPLGLGSIELFDVNFDENLQRWIITGNNLKLVSTNSSGAVFNIVNLSNTYGVIRSNFENGQYLEIKKTNLGTLPSIVKKIGNNVIDSIICPFQSSSAFNLTNQDIMILPSITGAPLCYYKTSTDQFFFLQDSIHNNQSIYPQATLVIGSFSNVILAAGKEGVMGRQTSEDSLNLYVSAAFNLIYGTGCPGDTLKAIAKYPYSDSLAWYLDDSFVSANDTLEIVFPENNITHQIKLVQYYQGRTHIQTNNFTSNFYNFPLYSVIADTSLCYNQNVTFAVKKIGGGSNSGVSVRMVRNGQVIYGPFPAPSNTNNYISLNANPLDESDTVFLEFYKSTACGEQKIGFTKFFHVGPNLETCYNLSLMDSTLCLEVDSVVLSFQSNLIGANYKFFDGANVILNTTTSTTDTTNLSYSPAFFYIGPTQETSNLTLTVSYDGCVKSNQSVPSFTIFNSNPQFEFYDFTTNLNDSIQLENFIPYESMTWKVEPSPSVLDSIHQIMPIISSNTAGLFAITLVNENSFGCKDSLTQYHYFTNQPPEESRSVCFDSSSVLSTVFESEIDMYGNYVECGYYFFDDWSTVKILPLIRKIDSQGNLLWQFYPNNNQGIARCLDVDNEQNTYVAIDLTTGPDGTVNNPLSGKYIIKYDLNGQVVDFVYNPDPFILDLKVDSDHHKIYAISETKLMEFDWNLDLIHSTPIFTSQFQSNAFFYGSNNQSLSAGSYDWRSPKIDILPNGDLVVVASVIPSNGFCNFGNQTFNVTNGDGIIIACKYSSGLGFTNGTKILTHTEPSFNNFMITDLTTDYDGNIYFITDSNYNFDQNDTASNNVIQFENFYTPPSFHDLKENYLIKLNDQLQTIWVRSTNLRETNLNFAQNTNKLYLTGFFEKSMYICGDNNFLSFDGKLEDELDEPNNLTKIEFGYVVVDTSGQPLDGAVFSNTNSNSEYYDSHRYHRLISTVSNCGELFLNFNILVSWVYQNTPLLWNVSIGGIDYVLDKSTVFKISTNSCTELCPAFQLVSTNASTHCLNSPLIVNFVGQGIDSISISEYSSLNQFVSNTSIFAINGMASYIPSSNSGYLVIQNPTNNFQYDSVLFNSIIPASIPLDSIYISNCNSPITVSIDTMIFSSVSWTDSINTWIGNSFNLGILNLDSSTMVYVHALDLNSCQSTGQIQVNQGLTPISIPLDSVYQLNCTNPMTLTLDSSVFDSVQWNNGTILWHQNTFTFDNFLLSNLTSTNVNVYAIDSNNCSSTHHFTIIPGNNPIVIPLDTLYQIACNDQIILSIDSTQFPSVLWSDGINYYTNDSITFIDSLSTINSVMYTVLALDSNLCQTTHQFTVDYCFDLGYNNSESNIMIYPNPTNGIIFIQPKGRKTTNIKLFSYLGDEIFISPTSVNDELFSFNLQNLSNGIYWIETQFESIDPVKMRIIKH